MSKELKAARARLNGAERLSSGACGSETIFEGLNLDVAGIEGVSCTAVDNSEAVGVGVGLALALTLVVRLAPFVFSCALFDPPPKKLFRLVCLPENSSINLVANLGGSGASLLASFGYTGDVLDGRSLGLSISRRWRVSPSEVMMDSCKSTYTGQWSDPYTLGSISPPLIHGRRPGVHST